MAGSTFCVPISSGETALARRSAGGGGGSPPPLMEVTPSA